MILKIIVWFSCLVFLLNIKVYSLSLKYTLTGPKGTVRDLAILKNGLLASGSDDYTLRIWNLENKSEIYCFNSSNGGHSNLIRSIVSLKDNYLASSSLDGTVKIWLISENPKLVQTLFDPNSSPVVELKSNENFLFSCYGDGSIKIWDISKIDQIKLKHDLKNDKDSNSSAVLSILILNNNKQIVSTSMDKTVKIWNIDEGSLNFTFDSKNNGHQYPVYYSAQIDDYLITSSAKNGEIKIWDLNNKNLIKTFNSSNGGHQGITFDFIVLKDLNYVASASDDKTIKIWDIKGGKLVSTLKHQVEVWDLIDLGKGFLASGAGDYEGTKGELNLWDVKNETLIQSFRNYGNKSSESHQKRIYSLILIDNKNLITGSVDQTIKVWNLN